MKLTTAQAKHLIELLQAAYEFDSLTIAHEHDRHNIAILAELARAYPEVIKELEREHKDEHASNLVEWNAQLVKELKKHDLFNVEEIRGN